MDQNTKPTPPAGTPIPTSSADPLERIRLAVEGVRSDVAATRAESRMRGEEMLDRVDKLDRKVDTLAKDDEQLRLADRRLEQRQAASDEELRDFQKEVRKDLKDLREELRKDREARDVAHASVTGTVDAMKRHVEQATQANTASVERAVAHLGQATQRFDDASVETKDRIDQLETGSKDTQEAVGAIVEQLGIADRVKLGPNPPPDEKPEPTLAKIEKRAEGLEARAKSSTIVQVIIALGVIAGLLERIFLSH